MMLDYLKAIVFGLVQGATEFIPVSSSGHLVLLHDRLGTSFSSSLAFDSFLHLGTLGAVLWFYRFDLWAMAKNDIPGFLSGKFKGNLAGWLALATGPAVLIGLLFAGTIEAYLRSPLVVAAMLVVVGILFLIVERPAKAGGPAPDKRDLSAVGAKNALLIGLAQAIALIPGTSRSGITITAGLWRGLDRQAAVKFSFLLSIPAIAGASALGIKELLETGTGGMPWPWLLTAFASAFVSGLLAIRFLVAYLKESSLAAFAYYRFLLAALILLYTFVF